MWSPRFMSHALWGTAMLFCTVDAVAAKPAQCLVSKEDNGHYWCRFIAKNRDGSFQISAPGRPTFTLNMVEPGVAQGSVNFGGPDISLEGHYRRSESEPACWLSDLDDSKICAW